MSSECIFLSLKTDTMTEVLFKDTYGNWIPTEEVDESNPIANSIGYFMIGDEPKGTGFVIKVNQNNSPYAIVLTCAHVFIGNELFLTNKPAKFIVRGEFYYCSIMPKFLNWICKAKFLRDPISGNRISIPDDWIFCELRKGYKNYTHSLIALNLSNHQFFPQETQVTVFGFPRPIDESSFDYSAPASEEKDMPILNSCIHGGNKLVLSHGKIISASNDIICVSCPTSHGMSGGPITVKIDNSYQVIGILFGGPAGATHKIIMLTIFETLYGNSLNALKKLLKKIKKQKRSIRMSGAQVCHGLRKFWVYAKLYIEVLSNGDYISKSEITKELLSYYKNVLSIEARLGRNLGYNIGIALEMLRHDLNRIM